MLVTDLRKEILKECKGITREWYFNWDKRVEDIEYCIVATKNGKPFSFVSYRSDGKVLCYLYTLRKYRNDYRGLVQIDYLSLHIRFAKVDEIYLTIDAYDKTHSRLAKAWDRKILSGVDDSLQPYRGKFEYQGVIEYRGTDQHKYTLDIKNITDLRNRPYWLATLRNLWR